MSKEIKMSVKKMEWMSYKALKPFQGDLKSLTEANFEKLKKEILDSEFSAALHAWCEEKKVKGKTVKTYYTLDGHQRCRVLGKMEEEGFKIPLVPVVIVDAPNYKAAKKKLLGMASQYGSMESQGLYEFVEESGLEKELLETNYNFPEVNAEKFSQEFYEEEVSFTVKKGNQDENSEKFCRHCGAIDP